MADNHKLLEILEDGGTIGSWIMRHVQEITSNMDEPYSVDIDSSGNLYLVNKDDDNVVKISSGGMVSVAIDDRLDDPRGLALGRVYAASGAAGAAGEADAARQNEGPDIDLVYNDTSVYGSITLHAPASFLATAYDAEGDAIIIGLVPGDLPVNSVSILDHQNGTAAISLDTDTVPAGTYVFHLTASDETNFELEPYAVIMP